MLEQICLPIKHELNEAERILGEYIVSTVSLATEVVQYTIANRGKRIRPALFLLAARLVGAPNDMLPSIAAALECFHTASLLHDDVVDEATMRRGKRAARLKWGNQLSVLVGDFLWCCGSSLVRESAPPRFLSCMSRAVRETVEGELLEATQQSNPDCDQETYIKIIEGKTAAIFAVCGQGAAILAEASPRYQEALENYSRCLGMAFQLTDDALDYAGEKTTMGKTPGSDLKEGRLTLPIIITLKKATGNERNAMRDALLSPKVDEDQLAEIVTSVQRHGGVQSTLSLAREYVEQAKSCLSVFRSSVERDALISLANYIVERER